MKQTGKILKSARESQRISVNEVAMATKISPRLIQAIEEGDLDALPAKTFLRGFVQSYASYLKLDVDELLEKFHEEMGSTLPPISKPEDLAQDEPRETKKSPPVLHEKGILSKLIAGGVILALIFIIIGVKNIVEKYEKEATVETPPENIQGLNSNDALTSGAVTTTGNSPTKTEEIKNTETTKDLPKDSEPEPTPEMKSETATAVTAPIPTEAQTAPLAQATPAKTPELPTASAENKKETPEEKKPETTEPPPQAQAKVESETPAPTQTPPPAPSANIKNEIILEALDTVEIEFRVGDGDLKRVILKPDQIHTIKAVGPVTIDLSDGGAVNLIHNGKDKGVPGDLGKPKKIRVQ